MSLSFGFKQGDPRLTPIEDKIFAAGKAQHLYWIGIGGRRPESSDRGEDCKTGYMIGSGEPNAAIGRKITKRPQPY